MSTTRQPLLSLSAKGSIASSLTYSNWRGINYARRKRQTPRSKSKVLTPRKILTAYIGNAWRYAITTAEQHAAWDRVPIRSRKPMTGFNAFFAALQMQIDEDPGNLSYAAQCRAMPGQVIQWDMSNAIDGSPGTDPREFTLTEGYSANTLQATSLQFIVAGTLSYVTTHAPGDMLYVRIFDGDRPRAGLSVVTVLA
jgi:hypothetical protein